ncbi:MAG: DNA replication/repair protein RecF [Gammaproteobacteria bacterium]|nr:DNA replication/repair protein RecF [Gammaproteobacteria bacterium]MBA3731733.1 DNA replication/repair protein RecF [Gammaproteobacteria bacterium]
MSENYGRFQHSAEMIIERLTIYNLRNIEHAEIQPSNNLNLICGGNAAGKSTILESIDLLSRGRSFRSHLFSQLVTTGQPQLTIAARLKLSAHSIYKVGIEKSRSGTRARIRGEPVESIAQVATLMPVQVLHPESHQLIQGGPSHRRNYLDWGMFHVEPQFLPTWRHLQRALNQRNAALKTGASVAAVRAWNVEFCETAIRIDQFRRSYLSMLTPVVADYVKELPGDADLKLRYQSGWPNDQSLDELLERELPGDMERGHTQRGPHRADLELLINDRPATGTASRGQQKLIAAALKLAQAKLLVDKTGNRCVFLVDDLPAELEPRYQNYVIQTLTGLGLQIFVTSIAAGDIKFETSPAAKMFHVEQGRVRELL